jgi:ubiquinone/menaquinone biosynthesis C-methylase UbiE
VPADRFTELEYARRILYTSADRLHRRTSALLSARTVGVPSSTVITQLLRRRTVAPPEALLDVGCGRGGLAADLVNGFPSARVTVLDVSAALLTEAVRRTGARSAAVQADFHQLPLREHTFDAVTAAFCLYHAADPREPLAELARILKPGGVLATATKSIDSYRELDSVIAQAGLASVRTTMGSLYASFSTENAVRLLSEGFEVLDVEEHRHEFTFTSGDHLSRYLATVPTLSERPDGVSAYDAIRRAVVGTVGTKCEIHATSTISYCVARPRSAWQNRAVNPRGEYDPTGRTTPTRPSGGR